jgi:hypothetical protein
MSIEPLKVAAPVLPGPRRAPAGPGLVGPRAGRAPSFRERWLTPESLKGWVSSLALHGALILALAFWYFGPAPAGPREFDGRLAGSEMGVDDGLTTTGGLNTELTIPQAEAESTQPVITTLSAPDLKSMEARFQDLAGSNKPSAGGGLNSNNPGAGNGDGFGLARFGQGGEKIHGVEVKVGDPQFTLIWDSPTDIDLHVIEPGGKEIYWEDPTGFHGGELDVDDRDGFGPENIYWLQDADGTGRKKVKGPGPPGKYRWFVVYYGPEVGIPWPTRWKVRIKHDGKVRVFQGQLFQVGDMSHVYQLNVVPPRADATGKPSTP